ncbi:MAG: DUF4440 domain-containing protein [Sphingomonadales bacterium]
MHRFLGALILCAIVPAASLASEPRQHIDEILIRFVAAFNAGDGATVAGFYAEDAALLPPDGARVDGRASIQAFWQGAIDSGMKIDELHAIEVDARQDLAGEVGVFTLSVPGESGVTKVAGKYVVIWKRTGHTWQLYRDIWNTD